MNDFKYLACWCWKDDKSIYQSVQSSLKHHLAWLHNCAFLDYSAYALHSLLSGRLEHTSQVKLSSCALAQAVLFTSQPLCFALPVLWIQYECSLNDVPGFTTISWSNIWSLYNHTLRLWILKLYEVMTNSNKLFYSYIIVTTEVMFFFFSWHPVSIRFASRHYCGENLPRRHVGCTRQVHPQPGVPCTEAVIHLRSETCFGDFDKIVHFNCQFLKTLLFNVINDWPQK